jgi:hypothetical protein
VPVKLIDGGDGIAALFRKMIRGETSLLARRF